MTPANAIDGVLLEFAAEVGPEGPVCVRGGDTRRRTGGDPHPGTREVRAPAGIVALEPAEMTVRVRAGTPVAELHEALGGSGQRTALPERPGGTVGGALMVGESAITRLGLGPVRDALLQARYVCADGRVATGGAATVKNVSGFDLCRLLVGSLGTIGLMGEALLRTVPVPETEQWFRLDGGDPRDVWRRCRTAISILWDGAATWVLLSGYAPRRGRRPRDARRPGRRGRRRRPAAAAPAALVVHAGRGGDLRPGSRRRPSRRHERRHRRHRVRGRDRRRRRAQPRRRNRRAHRRPAWPNSTGGSRSASTPPAA